MILEALQSHGWFPTQIRPNDLWLGGLIELQENSCLIHWQYEAGVMKRVTKIESFSSIDQAIEEFINEEFGNEIDGVPIK